MLKKVTWVTNIPLRDTLEFFGKKPRGSGFWLDALRDQLVATGLEIDVVTPTSLVTRPERIQIPYGTCYLVPLGTCSYVPYFSRKLLGGIASALSESSPQLVDYHGTEYGYPAAHRFLKMPAIVTLQGIMHDIVPQYFGNSGACSFYLKLAAGGSVRDILSTLWTNVIYRQRRALEREAFQVHRHFLGRTHFDKSWASRLHGSSISYHEAHRILRPAFYQCDKWAKVREPGSRFVITRTGRFTPDKGMDTLFKAIAILSHEMRVDVRLQVIGTHLPTAGWGRSLVRLSREIGIDDKIEYLGYMNESDIITTLLKSDAFALTSYSENSPNSLVEAMCLGLPCVASRVGGIPSIVEDGVTGLLYDALSAQDLANKLAIIEASPSRSLRMGRDASTIIMRRNSPSYVAEQTRKAYDAVYKGI